MCPRDETLGAWLDDVTMHGNGNTILYRRTAAGGLYMFLRRYLALCLYMLGAN